MLLRLLSISFGLSLIVAPVEYADAQAAVLEAAPSTRAMVATGHPEASKIGLAVLRNGGNAVDAAVAIGFAMAVVSPDAGNLGGGGFLVLREATGAATSWDFRERAPLEADRDLYTRTGASSQRGHLAVGVPGTVAGLLAAHRARGRLDLEVLIAPAIRLADGHYLSGRNAILFNRYRGDFSAFASTAAVFVKPDGESWMPGERFAQPDLAATLRRIRDDGHDGFYRGRTADLIVAEMERGGGLISHADLEAYRAIERPVLEAEYRGRRVIAMGPPSSGGIALAQVLAAVEPYEIGAWGPHDSRTVHLAGEALRRAFADRSHWLGDPDFVDVPVQALIRPRYVRQRMASFDPGRASVSLEVGHGTPPDLGIESTETTHVSVVDAEGNAVAMTVTLNDYFGSKVVVGGAGFLLNDEMDDFTARPGRPNGWGLIQGERNAIAPGKRMVSSMTPVILEDEQGRLALVAGSPGGARIISTVFQVLTNVVDHGLDAQAAVALPRYHHQWLPDELEHERDLPRETLEALRDRGWTLDPLTRFGAANIVVVRYDATGARVLEGGADPRRDDDDARGL
ncbi:gamma-glutamyltransferase [Rubrivirga sp.]|uniref:gamma-glutamyltransferase n=1 Tax=Rubrivirga sp. TaxID=1885344 RepID=UPI003C74FB6A